MAMLGHTDTVEGWRASPLFMDLGAHERSLLIELRGVSLPKVQETHREINYADWTQAVPSSMDFFIAMPSQQEFAERCAARPGLDGPVTRKIEVGVFEKCHRS
jgi:hypothetical protein